MVYTTRVLWSRILIAGLLGIAATQAHAQWAGMPGPVAYTTSENLAPTPSGDHPPAYEYQGFEAYGDWPQAHYGDEVCFTGGTMVNREVERLWLGIEYLSWRLDGSHLPPLVTASPAGTPLNQAGRLDDPSTQVLVGNEIIGDGWRDGWRIQGGFWLDNCRTWAIAFDYFDTGGDGYDYVSNSPSGLIIGRPFFNTETGQDDAQLISVPNELDGRLRVHGHSDFRGAGATMQQLLWCCGDPNSCCPSRSLMLLAGYRHLQFNSNLSISEDLTVLPGTSTPLVPGTNILVDDRFSARNEFHGGELGFQGRVKQSWWWVDGMAKLSIGNMHRSVTVDGQTINTVPGGGQAEFVGGILTSEVTNIGHYSDNKTVVIPEFRLGIGMQVTQRVSAKAGYNLIIWNDVAHAAAHLPPGLAVDPRNLPPIQAGGGSEPEFPGIRGSNLVAHGVDVGLEFTY